MNGQDELINDQDERIFVHYSKFCKLIHAWI